MERLNEHELLKDTCNNTIDIKFSAHEGVSGITFILYAQNQKMRKRNNLTFVSNNTKGPKQDSQNQQRSPMPERGKP